MTAIDSHSHIYLGEFDPDRSSILERAEKEGIRQILLPAIDSSTHEAMLNLESQYPSVCLAMMGIHPCSIKENYQQELKTARDWFEKRSFIGVGEIGLDFYWDKTFIKEQYAALHEQLEWALEYNIPFSLHSRSATEECIEVVSEHQKGKLKGVFHCFSGDENQAKKIINLGLYLGIGGVITFKNSGLDKIIESIGIDHIVLETDAPYLAPVPFRGKRNEPAYLKWVIEKLAVITNIREEEVRNISTKNAEKLFKLSESGFTGFEDLQD